jgi:predicted RNase H-like HicB family nuclease
VSALPSKKPCGYSDPVLVRVLYHQEPEGWWAESPDVERWLAAGDTFEEVRQLAEEGVSFALDDRPVEVKHFVPERSVPARA